MSDFLYEADLLCLDLVNTRYVRRGVPVDSLGDFDALISWLTGAGVLGPVSADRAVAEWGGHPGGVEAWRMALELRDGVRDASERMIADQPIGDEALAAINGVLARLPAVLRIAPTGERARRFLEPVSDDPTALLFPVAESAAALLTELDPTRVGRCDGPECVLYYYDWTRNRSRRWCSMSLCGARAKSAAYYRRQRAKEG